MSYQPIPDYIEERARHAIDEDLTDESFIQFATVYELHRIAEYLKEIATSGIYTFPDR